MKSRIWKNGLYAACLAAGVTLGGGAPALAAELPAGLQVGGQDLGGLDREEADQKIEEYVNGLQDQQISIHVGIRFWRLLQRNWDLPGATGRRWMRPWTA